jgi:hypothetical protein
MPTYAIKKLFLESQKIMDYENIIYLLHQVKAYVFTTRKCGVLH